MVATQVVAYFVLGPMSIAGGHNRCRLDGHCNLRNVLVTSLTLSLFSGTSLGAAIATVCTATVTSGMMVTTRVVAIFVFRIADLSTLDLTLVTCAISVCIRQNMVTTRVVAIFCLLHSTPGKLE
jgi:hypothetical protein